ncbi:hypothetical protein BDR06DRAFT_508082 [Suillus hirtellus]|nr:hypothetical protein BDR06DRAFT_508082 [Suillus hirtellus]
MHTAFLIPVVISKVEAFLFKDNPLDITTMASKSTTGLLLDSANIMSTVLEGVLYGFSVLMFIGTIWTFTYK